MRAAIHVKHHPRQRPPRTSLVMLASFAALGYQAGRLQSRLDPRITEPHMVFLVQLFDKVPHIEVKVLLPVQF